MALAPDRPTYTPEVATRWIVDVVDGKIVVRYGAIVVVPTPCRLCQTWGACLDRAESLVPILNRLYVA